MDNSLLDSYMISELIKGVLKVCGDSVKQITLYGSVARHEETEESDIDIALILNQELSGETRTQFIKWASKKLLSLPEFWSQIPS
ncbi:MAG: nucleotidyltransferase domain-containing protein [Lachnospiraceae bacterium]|nr:nucleotidyltransferase domain-containing protein [Lachnospiraceae bacterium]